MVLGVGVDIIEIERVAHAMLGARFCQRVFTADEMGYIRGKGGGGKATAAGLFAAKEAIAKALGTGILHMNWNDVCIAHDGRGRPVAVLSGEMRARMDEMGGRAVHVSVSHSATHAVAYAMLEGNGEGAWDAPKCE